MPKQKIMGPIFFHLTHFSSKLYSIQKPVVRFANAVKFVVPRKMRYRPHGGLDTFKDTEQSYDKHFNPQQTG